MVNKIFSFLESVDDSDNESDFESKYESYQDQEDVENELYQKSIDKIIKENGNDISLEELIKIALKAA